MTSDRHIVVPLGLCALLATTCSKSAGPGQESTTLDAGSAVSPGDASSDSGDGASGARDGYAGAADGPAGAAAPSTIYSGVPWLDTDGNLVNAHGVGFIQVGSTYYMVGEQRSGANDTYSGAPINAEDTFTGVSMYSTTDFAHWTFVGTVVTPIAGTIVAPPYYGERPKILYNASTGDYVIYIKMLNYTGDPPNYVGFYAVLTSSTIGGPYAYHGALALPGANDFQVFQDADGTQYFARDGGTLYKLSPDGLTIVSTIATDIQSGEGPSLYVANGVYFWQSSQGTYWHANDDSYASATSLLGPWTQYGFFCPGGTDTWDTQDTAVVTITGSAGRTYMYVGDRWVNGDLPASTLVFQPMIVNGSKESIPAYQPVWNLDVAAGTWSAATPAGTSVNDGTVGTGASAITNDASWAPAPCSDCFGADMHSSATADGTATIAFQGTQILLYSAYDSDLGIMGVTVLDANGAPVTPEVDVSLRYDAPAAGDYMVYASPVLAEGAYTLQVRVTGRKDFYSTGTACNVDRAFIVP